MISLVNILSKFSLINFWRWNNIGKNYIHSDLRSHSKKYVTLYGSIVKPKCQFHQHFTCTFCANIFAPKKFKRIQSQNVIREKLLKALSYEKLAQKMLMKLTTGRQLSHVTTSILNVAKITILRLWWKVL